MLKALLSGVGPFAGGLVDAFSNIGYNNRAKELAKYQYDLNMQAWREQNEYNKPINQVARLIEAGLNPQLAYGNGTQAGNASQAPQFQAPQLQRVQGFGAAASSAVQSAINAYQLKLNAEKQKGELDLMAAQADYQREIKNKAAAESLYILSRKGGQDISNELLQFQKEVQNDRYNREVEAYNRDMELKDAELQFKATQIDNLDSQTRLFIAQSITQNTLRAQMMAAIDNLHSQASSYRSQASYYDAQTEWQTERNKLKSQFAHADYAELQNKVTLLIKQGRATEISNAINEWFEKRAQKGIHPYGPTSPVQFLDLRINYLDEFFNSLP